MKEFKKLKLEEVSWNPSLSSFRSFTIRKPIFDPYWHFHPEVELTLITKGRGMRYVGDSIESYSVNDLVLLGPNVPHHWVSLAGEANAVQEAFVIQFPIDLFDTFPECKSISSWLKKSKSGFHFPEPDADFIHRMTRFESQSSIQQLSSLMIILDRLKGLNHRVLSSHAFANRPNRNNDEKMVKTTQFILEHLDQPLNVQQMAGFTNMVPQSFCRWFKLQTGHSFISFLNRSRIQRACHLLLSPSYPIQDIAFDCGFSSVSHFNRTFKKLKGVSPGWFRKSQALLASGRDEKDS